MSIKYALQTGVNPYMLLGRLETDCKYFLGYGNRNPAILWAGSVDRQIFDMLYLYRHLPKKPAWISRKKIRRYYQKMLISA